MWLLYAGKLTKGRFRTTEVADFLCSSRYQQTESAASPEFAGALDPAANQLGQLATQVQAESRPFNPGGPFQPLKSLK
jgi:hypothetical protein